MDLLRWILLAAVLVLLVLWVVRYGTGRDRSRAAKVIGLLLLSVALNSIASWVGDTRLGITILSLSVLSMVVCAVLGVSEVRATWRAQMDRVKHL